MTRSRNWLIAGVIAASIHATASAGEDRNTATELANLSLDELMQMRVETVYGASKYEQKVTRAPASVTLITAEDIARFGYRTLSEALRSVRGLYVSDDRNYSYVGTRGFLRPGDYNSRLLLLIDGHRVNDNVYDSAYFGREAMVPVDMIERIEVVRGPSSSIYGSSAFFGIVNVVLKEASQIDGASISGAGGSFGGYEGTVTLGDVHGNGLGSTFSASYFGRHGHRTLYFPEFDPAISGDVRASDGGIATDRDGERALGLTGSVRYGSFRVSGAIRRREKEVPTASFGTAFNQAEQTLDERMYLDATYEWQRGNDLGIRGRLAFDRYVYEGDYPFDLAQAGDPPDIVMNKDDTLGTSVSTEWQLKRTIPGGHTLVAGFELRENLKQRQLSFDDVEPRVYKVFDDRQTRNGGLYLQGEFRLAQSLLLNAGLRYDHYFESFGGTLNPRVGAILNPTERTTFKLLYGEAFRAPNAYERFYYPPAEGSPTLEPENIRTYEGVFEQYLGTRDRLSLSVYHYDVRDLVSQVADAAGELYFRNVARVSAHGAEIEFERKYDAGVLVRASYAWQHTYNPDTDEDLTSSPQHLAKVNVALPVQAWGFLGAELQHQGAVRTLGGVTEEAFTIGNVNFHTTALPHGFGFSAGVYNVFGARYAYPGAEDHLQDTIAQDGRTYWLKLSRRF